MPILPLDHPEPFAAVLGVMLYPGTDEDDRRKARATGNFRGGTGNLYARAGNLRGVVQNDFQMTFSEGQGNSLGCC